ncbi:MAG: hypothetical protein JSV03_00520 [Planctomycetota bacterium]|nr:MAG: hypothetical protein JSV03_00520 [Planctomycetota bacterium]
MKKLCIVEIDWQLAKLRYLSCGIDKKKMRPFFDGSVSHHLEPDLVSPNSVRAVDDYCFVPWSFGRCPTRPDAGVNLDWYFRGYSDGIGSYVVCYSGESNEFPVYLQIQILLDHAPGL